jgi:uncharacterized FlaG/YvyC family protein
LTVPSNDSSKKVFSDYVKINLSLKFSQDIEILSHLGQEELSMEANLRAQANMAPSNSVPPMETPTRVRPERTPAQAPTPQAPSIIESAATPSVDVLSTSSNVSVSFSSAADLASSEFPLPFSDVEISESTIARYVNAVNEALAPSFFRLNFNIHEDTNLAMIQVVDVSTNEILREIPPESRLDIMARIQEFAGLLFDERT